MMFNKYLAECLGTMAFIYVIFSIGDAVAIGVALAIMIMVIGGISGGHMNPAVSVAMVAANKLPAQELLPYVIAQIIGGVIAYQIYKQ